MSSQSGLSIIATVMAMLILALFAAAAVSLVTTSTGSGIQEERGVGAFYIAEGGMQYTLKKNTYPYYDGYYDAPISDDPVTDKALGDGSFSVTVPTLSGNIDSTTDPVGISLSSTDGFTLNPGDSTNYWVLICGSASARPTITMSSDCEKFSCNSDFSSCTRGRDSTVAATHPTDTVVMMYAWKTSPTTTLARDFAKGSKCKNAPSRICLADTAGFASSGFIRISNATENNIEDVFYDGVCRSDGTGCTVDVSTTCGSTCTGATAGCLGTTSCTRSAFDGNGNGTTTHALNTQILQSEFSVIVTSEGKTPGAILGPLSSIKRVLQTNVLPLKDP